MNEWKSNEVEMDGAERNRIRVAGKGEGKEMSGDDKRGKGYEWNRNAMETKGWNSREKDWKGTGQNGDGTGWKGTDRIRKGGIQ